MIIDFISRVCAIHNPFVRVTADVLFCQVTVHIPNAESANQNLLIVGEASNAANAEQHILRLMQKVDDRAKVILLIPVLFLRTMCRTKGIETDELMDL